MGNVVAVRVRLGGGVGVGGGFLVAATISAIFWIVSIVWVPKRSKGAASAGLVRALVRRLDASVAASVEDIAGMALLLGKTLLLLLCALPVYLAHRCGSIGSGVGSCQCTALPCHEIPKFASAVAFYGLVILSLVGPWGSGCSQTPHLAGPPLIV